MLFIGVLIFVFSFAVHGGPVKDVCPKGWTILDRGLNAEDISIVVNSHNKNRLKVARGTLKGQPRGIDLKKMSYDSILATKARPVSNSCKLQNLVVKDDRWSVVYQNAWMECGFTHTPKHNWQKIMNAWFNRHNGYKFPTKTKKGSLTDMFYGQMVWANTTKVGCDYIYFVIPNNGFRGSYCKMYTCNYAPGSVEGQIPYTVGCDELC